VSAAAKRAAREQRTTLTAKEGNELSGWEPNPQKRYLLTPYSTSIGRAAKFQLGYTPRRASVALPPRDPLCVRPHASVIASNRSRKGNDVLCPPGTCAFLGAFFARKPLPRAVDNRSETLLPTRSRLHFSGSTLSRSLQRYGWKRAPVQEKTPPSRSVFISWRGRIALSGSAQFSIIRRPITGSARST
jgi:hypothetical protein